MKNLKIFLHFIYFLSLVTIFPFFTDAFAMTYEPPFDVSAQAVYLVNQDTGDVMYEKNPELQLSPASLTKIMTAILTLENAEDLYTENTYLKMYLNEMIVGTGLSTGGLYPNDSVYLYDAMAAMLIQSASECALMLADYFGDGSVSRFVDLMNQRALELGCTNTNFANPHGLYDEYNYSTAKDMAIIASHAMTFPEFREIVNKTSHTFTRLNKETPITVYTTNQMLSNGYSYYYSPVEGIKTGTLTERYLATQAKYNGYTYLLILLDVPKYYDNGTLITTDDGREARLEFTLAEDLFRWVFTSFDLRTIVDTGEEREEIHVEYSFETDFVRLATSESFSTLLHSEIELSSIQYTSDLPEYLEAPIQKGQTVGYLHMSLAGEHLGTVPLITTKAIEADQLLLFLGWLDNAVHLYSFKFGVSLGLIGTTTLIVFLARIRNVKRRRGKYSSNNNFFR